MNQYDLLLEGGTRIDPSQRIHPRNDVAFAVGRVACVGPLHPDGEVVGRVNCSGRLVADCIANGVDSYWKSATLACLLNATSRCKAW